mmetsp:Transcript_2324/g.8675  ORF Transcript_2324/g.8675 Transcript_2324/m.8675 type:complete len:235 (+) Transcript_2324:1555-2259(+)
MDYRQIYDLDRYLARCRMWVRGMGLRSCNARIACHIPHHTTHLPCSISTNTSQKSTLFTPQGNRVSPVQVVRPICWDHRPPLPRLPFDNCARITRQVYSFQETIRPSPSVVHLQVLVTRVAPFSRCQTTECSARLTLDQYCITCSNSNKMWTHQPQPWEICNKRRQNCSFHLCCHSLRRGKREESEAWVRIHTLYSKLAKRFISLGTSLQKRDHHIYTSNNHVVKRRCIVSVIR